MPRGGARPGAGRPKGSTSVARKGVVRAVERLEEPNILAAISVVAEDSALPWRVRREAAHLLHGVIVGRIRQAALRRTTSPGAQDYSRPGGAGARGKAKRVCQRELSGLCGRHDPWCQDKP